MSGGRIPKRVAVIAVHGVGDHAPCQSARSIAGLLLRTPADATSRYTSFGETAIDIPTRPLHVASSSTQPKSRYTYAQQARASTTEPTDIAFMRQLVENYVPSKSDRRYSSVRLEGKRINEPESSSGPRSDERESLVHVYEMYWSDISRIGPGILSILGAFYQLVIHLPYVGGLTLSHAKPDIASHRLWRAIIWSYGYAKGALTLFAPTLNIVMFAAALGVMTRHVNDAITPILVRCVLFVALLAAVVVLLRKLNARRGLLAVFLMLAAGLAAALVPVPQGPRALLAAYWLVMALPLWLLFRAFQRNRPGALALGIACYVATAISFGVLFAFESSGNPSEWTTKIVVHTLEYFAVIQQVTWLVFGAAFAVTVALSLIWSIWYRKDAEHRRMLYTARFALALPTVLFSLGAFLVWGGFVAAESSALQDIRDYEPHVVFPVVEARMRTAEIAAHAKQAQTDTTSSAPRDANVRTARAYVVGLWGAGSTLFGAVATLVVLIALILVVATLAPVIWTERNSPSAPPTTKQKAEFESASKRLGLWLTLCFRVARVAGEGLVVTCFIFLVGLLFVIPVLSTLIWPAQWIGAVGTAFSGTPDSVVASLLGGAGTITLVTVLGRFSKFGLGLRPVLGVAVDVDNYLRELPRDRTPRARMVERYVSLLRHLCAWRRDPADPSSGYDVMVIVSHSQGTVITADLLRYLQHEHSKGRGIAGLEKLADGALGIRLMTMGSPLRQLYALRFPTLYGWVGFDGPAGPVVADLLGVERWRNLFRSGDYVGRGIWADADERAAIFAVSEERQPSPCAIEECIGPGAHTHYWDETADCVGTQLDAMIADRVVHSSEPRYTRCRPAQKQWENGESHVAREL